MSTWEFFMSNRNEFFTLVWQHLMLVAISTSIALIIGIPVGIMLTRQPRLRAPVLGFANIMQTVPSLALFGFLIPLPFIGGIGARTAIVALVLYALLPVIRNTVTGILGVDKLAAAVGVGGLGTYIFRALRQYDNRLILAGAVPAALMALGADFGLGL